MSADQRSCEAHQKTAAQPGKRASHRQRDTIDNLRKNAVPEMIFRTVFGLAQGKSTQRQRWLRKRTRIPSLPSMSREARAFGGCFVHRHVRRDRRLVYKGSTFVYKM